MASFTIDKIISGGQTGVDRAALDTAIISNIPHGGWCPAGRRAEDGAISESYQLTETPSNGYARRTEWNVRDSDGTLILNRGELEGGTALTVEYARRHRKPCYIVPLDGVTNIPVILNWLRDNNIRVLNLAGPRESKQPGIYDEARAFLEALLVQEGE